MLQHLKSRRIIRGPKSGLAVGSGGWYPGLDGVRGLAVGMVFSVHYIGKYSIGWMGVIAFFVLSGFLITGVLYDSRNQPHRFRNFYIRRTLRIFPLFYFVWLCIVLAAPFLREEWHATQLLWPTYLGNYARFVAGTPAVDHINTRLNWLPIEIGHFWSLAVEEQFYLLWPLVVFKVADRGKLVRICLGVMVTVLLLRIALVLFIPVKMVQMEFLYRMTFSQADSFLCGGLLALWIRGPKKIHILKSGPYIFFVSVALLGLACWLNDPGSQLSRVIPATPWMSAYGFTLIYLVAAGLLLSSLSGDNVLSRFMNFRPLRLLGKYSYGFYVYHVLLRPILVEPMGELHSHMAFRVSLCVDFLIVFAVSAASYHLVEMPFLKLKDRFTGRRQNDLGDLVPRPH
jgi:peptidoglycan/LPS O-acetylase OafA/YrhL